MIVLAIGRGYYGGKSRVEGERFAISDKEHFSKRWMVDPSGSDFTSAHRAMEMSYMATSNRPLNRGITDEQLLAEVTQSAGVVAGLRAENLQLKEKVSALQGQLDQLLAKGEPGRGNIREEPARAKRRSVEAEPERAPEPVPDEAEEASGDVGQGEEAPATRRVRRTN
jgi:hypothetical protein